ncbi:hypothetical protein DD595_11880 [Enterobacter cloacae complex sp. 4DZ3-17B2]|nr:hypothetical protein DD595_11880 [Enterobacter cloacae complex sp. 4DZ3-17B2]
MSSIRRHCQPLADLTPLIAKLAFSPDSVLPSWAGLLTLAPLIRNAPADKDDSGAWPFPIITRTDG